MSVFRVTEYESVPEIFEVEFFNGFEGKIWRHEHRHAQVWSLLVYRPGTKKRLHIEHFEKFEYAFYRARTIPSGQLEEQEKEAVNEDLKETGEAL